MATIISLLRGINVSGQKKILMTDLRNLYESLDFSDVSTYIQSGNVIFNSSSKKSLCELNKMIEDAIENQYGFFVPVINKTPDEINHIAQLNPFKDEAIVEANKVYITFLDNPPKAEDMGNLEELKQRSSPDRFEIIENAIYFHFPNGAGTSRLNNTLFEKKLNRKATTRNWRTVTKLLELAKN